MLARGDRCSRRVRLVDFAQLVPIITTSLTVLGTLLAGFSRSDSAPREVRLLVRLAEAAGHVGHETPGGKALDAALQELADGYAERARTRRSRKVNGGNVAALIFVGLLGAVAVYFLSMLALWLGTLTSMGGWAIVLAILAWLLVTAVGGVAIGLLAVGSRTIYDQPKPSEPKRRA